MTNSTSKIILALLIALLAGASVRAEAANDWKPVAEAVAAEVDRAAHLVSAGHAAEAKDAVLNAYFGIFEGKKMEDAERATLGQTHVAEVEGLFNDLRKAAGRGDDLRPLASRLRATLEADAAALDADPAAKGTK